MRSCAACQKKGPKENYVRIVRTREGEIHVEPPRSLPGRGSYLCREVNCWVAGIDDGRLARSLRGAVPRETGAALLARARTEFSTERP